MQQKTPINKFNLYYKSNGIISEPEPEPFTIFNEKVIKSDANIRKHFRNMLKRFNNTLKGDESPRTFFKVTREFKVKLKSGKTINKFIKI